MRLSWQLKVNMLLKIDETGKDVLFIQMLTWYHGVTEKSYTMMIYSMMILSSLSKTVLLYTSDNIKPSIICRRTNKVLKTFVL